MNSTNSVPAAAGSVLNTLHTAVWIHDLQTLRPLWANQATLKLWQTPALEDFLRDSFEGWSQIVQWVGAEADAIRQGRTVQQQHAALINNELVHLDCSYSKTQFQPGQDFILVEAHASPAGQIPETITPGHSKLIEERLRQRGKRDRLLGIIVQRIRQSLDLKDVLDTAVSEIRAMFEADRVLIYRFEVAGGTLVVAESVHPSFPALLGQKFADIPQPQGIERSIDYTWNIANLREASSSNLDLSYFLDLEVQALLALPIIRGDHLWGGLVVQQCTHPRSWELSETDLITQLTNQIAIAIQQSELYQQLQQRNQELQYLASHDPLTNLANRRYFNTYLDHEWYRLARTGTSLAILVCDVDYFKAYNDTYGHVAGDECLLTVAQAIKQAVKRPADLVARYGGEEFAVILPETEISGAIHIAQRIQQMIHALQIPHPASAVAPYLTLSLGISVERPHAANNPHALLDKADRALYTAKAQGRNRYYLAP